jgi:hypothetical protein
LIRDNNILEFEKLLCNCQHLDGLYIINNKNVDHLLKILTKSSPNSLFKFKIFSDPLFELKSLKLFLNSWEGRHPMLLQIYRTRMLNNLTKESMLIVNNLNNLIEEYKEKGIVKKYDCIHDNDDRTFENFEWIQKKV